MPFRELIHIPEKDLPKCIARTLPQGCIDDRGFEGVSFLGLVITECNLAGLENRVYEFLVLTERR